MNGGGIPMRLDPYEGEIPTRVRVPMHRLGSRGSLLICSHRRASHGRALALWHAVTGASSVPKPFPKPTLPTLPIAALYAALPACPASSHSLP